MAGRFKQAQSPACMQIGVGILRLSLREASAADTAPISLCFSLDASPPAWDGGEKKTLSQNPHVPLTTGTPPTHTQPEPTLKPRHARQT